MHWQEPAVSWLTPLLVLCSCISPPSVPWEYFCSNLTHCYVMSWSLSFPICIMTMMILRGTIWIKWYHIRNLPNNTWHLVKIKYLPHTIIYRKSKLWFHSYVGFKTENNKWTNKTNKQTITHRHRQQHGDCQREGGKGGNICYSDRGRSNFGWWTQRNLRMMYYRIVHSCTLETYKILLTNVTPKNLI